MEDLATLIVAMHLLWIVWVAFGALWTRGRRFLTLFHILALMWGIIVEASPAPCPLILAEDFLQQRAGVRAYQGGFPLHYLDRIVYPDLPDVWITGIGVAVCVSNVAVYLWRWLKAQSCANRRRDVAHRVRQSPD
jgi:hypothetical protein